MTMHNEGIRRATIKDEEFIASYGPKYVGMVRWWFEKAEWILFTAAFKFLFNKTNEVAFEILYSISLGAITLYVFYVSFLKFDIRKVFPERIRYNYIMLIFAVAMSMALSIAVNRAISWLISTISKYEIV